MGQKVNPNGFRVGVIKDWNARWYAKGNSFGDTLVEDIKLRDFVKNAVPEAGISQIEIERDAHRIRINIHTAKPGILIGKGGSGIDNLKKKLEGITGKTVLLNVVEIKRPELDAQLVAENIALQLERRISFRRAMKQAMSRTMKAGAKGIKAQVAGRLGGAEIARTETYHDGIVPLQTLRADIDYGFTEAKTTYGRIGVKVWINKGEILPAPKKEAAEGGM